MPLCPTCRGSGIQRVQVVTRTPQGTTTTETPITCIICNGKKIVLKRVIEELKAEMEMWCRCKPPSEDFDFFDDGEHPEVHKHHYRCKKCGGITQIG